MLKITLNNDIKIFKKNKNTIIPKTPKKFLTTNNIFLLKALNGINKPLKPFSVESITAGNKNIVKNENIENIPPIYNIHKLMDFNCSKLKP